MFSCVLLVILKPHTLTIKQNCVFQNESPHMKYFVLNLILALHIAFILLVKLWRCCRDFCLYPVRMMQKRPPSFFGAQGSESNIFKDSTAPTVSRNSISGLLRIIQEKQGHTASIEAKFLKEKYWSLCSRLCELCEVLMTLFLEWDDAVEYF